MQFHIDFVYISTIRACKISSLIQGQIAVRVRKAAHVVDPIHELRTDDGFFTIQVFYTPDIKLLYKIKGDFYNSDWFNIDKYFYCFICLCYIFNNLSDGN